MNRLKIMGLALATCSVCAIYASGAAATTDVYTCGQSTCFVTGEQVGEAAQNVLGIKGAAVETHCTTVTSSSVTVISGGSSVTAAPSFSGCTTAGSSSPVDVNGCTITGSGVTDPYTNTNGVSEGEVGTGSLNCTGTNKIQITGSGCTISFGSQAGLKGANADNIAGTPDDVLGTVKIDNIAYTASGSLCDFFGFSTPGGTNAFITGRATFKAYGDVNGAEGSQINLTVS
jgi:hypothetical protein